MQKGHHCDLLWTYEIAVWGAIKLKVDLFCC